MEVKRLHSLKTIAFLFLFSLVSIAAFGDTIPAGKGTLTFSVSGQQQVSCGVLMFYNTKTLSNFSYTDPTNGKTSFPGAEMSFIIDSYQGGDCPDNTTFPQTLILTTPSGDVITFTAASAVRFTATVQYPK